MKIPLKSGLFFWVGGLIAWFLQAIDWQPYWHDIKPEDGIVLVFCILFVMTLFTVLVKRFDVFILRFLEGYHWPFLLRFWIIDKKQKCFWGYEKKERRFQELANKAYGNPYALTGEEREEYARLDQEFMYLPELERRMPTRLGNILRAAEQRPQEKYGLDAIICWPRLWLVLPDAAKAEITQARNNLNDAAQIWLWGVLLVIWTVWTWWAIPVALLLAFVAYHWMIQAAEIYVQLVESSFDLYRFSLYNSLHWPKPANPAEEYEQGQQLTAYLWRGSEQTTPTFSHI
ncbi:hypothetical protein PN36_19325 [Candidatus Thiomargarita nelsonii]|uniref:Uncharacterized protein n=1 Tax=Candidatus Thiomargarita nelsonii TaxID=1003181 RepID=A0A4E0QQ17_9GAMM|nr:hypothetical protein PN36_19325 [Candidatus Thiomargarita nelsonii]